MDEHLPFESELIARIGWLIRLRWLAVVGTGAAIALAALWFPGALAVEALTSVTLVIAVYNLLLYLNLRSLRIGPSGQARLRHATWLAYAQILLDLAALAALIHFSGGVENPMLVFFVFHVIIASILLERTVSYLMAGVAALLIAASAGLERAGILTHYQLPFVPAELHVSPLYLAVSVTAMLFALFVVAYLATSITTRLRERDRQLFERTVACQLRSEELAHLNEQLRLLDAERTRFMVLVTHELRAPVGTIFSALELVRTGYTSPEETEEMLHRAQNRASELLELISDLLDLTKLREQGVKRGAAPPMQIGDVLRDVVEFVRAEALRNDLSLEVEVEPDLSPVRASVDQIKLVWTNLLSNAIKYNCPGGSVRVRLSQDAHDVVGEVSDTGIGIPPEDLAHVFEEFYRAANAKLVSPHGTGVGMAIVRRIIESWGGSIGVKSEVGRGTTFSFRLPRADASPAMPSRPEDSVREPAEPA